MKKFDQARSYDRISSHQREDGYNLMKLLDLQKGNKLLDLGCGIYWLPHQCVGQQSRTHRKGKLACKILFVCDFMMSTSSMIIAG